MSYRQMRLILFFDLPMVTNAEKREYRKFRKMLTNEGFIMVQESVYSKLVLNSGSAKFVHKKIVAKRPPQGLIQTMIITEKQFNGIEYVLGTSETKIISNIERLIVI